MIEITQKLLPISSQRRSGQKILGINHIVSHDTGNDGSTANQNASYYFNSAQKEQASAHYFVDDKQIICVIPEIEKAWHVRYLVTKDNELFGKDSNDWSIGIELCFHSKNILVDNLKAYQNYVELHAHFCKKYNINPKTNIVGHYLLDPTRRTDPLNAFKYIGKNWEQFTDDVAKLLEPVVQPVVPATPVSTIDPNETIKKQIVIRLNEVEAMLDLIK